MNTLKLFTLATLTLAPLSAEAGLQEFFCHLGEKIDQMHAHHVERVQAHMGYQPEEHCEPVESWVYESVPEYNECPNTYYENQPRYQHYSNAPAQREAYQYPQRAIPVGKAVPFERERPREVSYAPTRETYTPRPAQQTKPVSRRESARLHPVKEKKPEPRRYQPLSSKQDPAPKVQPKREVTVKTKPRVETSGKEELPFGIPVPGKKGLVRSPFQKDAGYVDVTDITSGTQVKDPYTGKVFLVP